MSESSSENVKILSLHKYFIYADRMRVHFDAAISAPKKSGKSSADTATILYISLWYGMMFVVIEGWLRLNLADPRIDKLLESPLVEELKKYRHSVFHFHEDYYNERLINAFILNDESVRWIRELRDEFSRYFLDWLEARRLNG